MSVVSRIINPRIRSVHDMRHKCNYIGTRQGRRSTGIGKWASKNTLWAYWKKRKRASKVAAASRAHNRRTA